LKDLNELTSSLMAGYSRNWINIIMVIHNYEAYVVIEKKNFIIAVIY